MFERNLLTGGRFSFNFFVNIGGEVDEEIRKCTATKVGIAEILSDEEFKKQLAIDEGTKLNAQKRKEGMLDAKKAEATIAALMEMRPTGEHIPINPLRARKH